MTNKQMHDTLKGITDNRRTIVTHGGTAHFDELMGIAIILAVERKRLSDNWDPPAIIRTRNKELIEGGNIVVDVGQKYNPANMRFDHHQDDNLPCAFHLVAEHFLEPSLISTVERIHPWWNLLDRIDREGGGSINNQGWRKVSAAPIGAGIRHIFAKRHFVFPEDWRYDMLLQIGIEFLQDTRDLVSDIESILSDYRYDVIGDHSVFITSQPADGSVFSALWRMLGRQAEITVSQDAQENYAVYSQENTVDLTILQGSDAEFVHPSGFLAVFDTMDKAEKELDRLLSSL